MARRTSNQRIQFAADEIRRAVNANSLEWPDLSQLLNHYATIAYPPLKTESQAALMHVASQIIRDGVVPTSEQGFTLLIDALEDLFDVEIDEKAKKYVATKVSRLLRAVTSLFAGFLLCAVSYLLFGSMLEGKSALIHSPLLAIMLLIALLLLLATVEALHISVVTLRLRDMHSSQKKYPRTFRLYQVFKSEEGSRRFLAGRQFFVIMTVFVVAQLTSFAHEQYFPFTTLRLPGLVNVIFLRLGLLGALFVLWVGQLAPQFYANKQPRQFMNAAPVGWLFKIAISIERLGVTRPGEWLSAWIKEDDRIPSSPRERYQQAVREIEGFGTASVRKSWRIGRAGAMIDYRSVGEIWADNLPSQIVDNMFSIRIQNPKDFVCSCMLVDRKSGAQIQNVLPDVDRNSVGRNDWHNFSWQMSPQVGSFESEQVVVSNASVSGIQLGEDAFKVVSPTKFLLFRLICEDVPYQVSAKVRVSRSSNIGEAGESVETVVSGVELRSKVDEDGSRVFYYTVEYPDVKTLHEITWNLVF